MPRENSYRRTEPAGPAEARAGPGFDQARAARRRARLRLLAVLAAIAVYLGVAFWMKPGAASRVADSIADIRDSVSDRFHKHPDHPIDLNTATAAELAQLPGIGHATAAEIIRFRQQSGPIRRLEDLLAIPRITRRAIERIRPYIVMENPR